MLAATFASNYKPCDLGNVQNSEGLSRRIRYIFVAGLESIHLLLPVLTVSQTVVPALVRVMLPSDLGKSPPHMMQAANRYLS